jgi:hypothetical protein
VAILAALVALGSRFATKILTTALGWASTLLFGRVPASRQILLLGVTFGSVIWMVLVAGVIVPQLGTFLLFLIPPQQVVPEGVIRLAMLIGALVLPALIGGLTLALSPEQERGARAVLEAVLRGYPLTILLAVLLVFLAGLAVWRKVGALLRHWDDAHVPLVVKPGAYEQVATDLRRAIVDAGLDVEARPASAAMSKPAKWIAAVGGRSSSALVPERMLQLRGRDLDILIYPMDLLISGKPELLARARAAMASRLTTTAAHLTVSAEAQAIEDRLTTLANGDPERRPRFDDAAAATFTQIDGELATVVIPYDEWEVLYRQRLQVERDLRVGAMADEALIGMETPGVKVIPPALGQVLHEGAEAFLDAATDKRTTTALDRLAGTELRLGVLVAAMAASALSFVLRGRFVRRPDRIDDDRGAEETA